jgi:uncharacterized repeat protein (TIGR01451 family)
MNLTRTWFGAGARASAVAPNRGPAVGILALLWGVAFAAPVSAEVEILPLASPWRYQQGTNLGGVNWQATAYGDASWPGGNALFYVETNVLVSPRATPLTLGSTTYYFRTHLPMLYEPTHVVLAFSARIDDGAVFYLNGQEIQRVRLAPAPAAIGYASLATGTPTGGDATAADTFTLSGTNLAALRTGDNVLAVEVHQNATNSDDLVFGTAVSVRFTNSPPILVQAPTDLTVQDGRPAALVAVIDGNPAPVLQWFKAGSPIVGATNVGLTFAAAYPTHAGTYWLTASNRNGWLTTTNVLLTVLADTERPWLVSALAQKSLTNIAVAFSEPIRAATATNAANFAVYPTLAPSNGLAITGVALSGDSGVVVRTEPRTPGLHYTLRVSGVEDLASVGNPIATNSEIALSYEVDLIAVDAPTQWKYSQAGSLPATHWMAPAFDDSNWPAGAALFHAGTPLPGTGDPIRTTLALTAGATPVTAYYFRTDFELPGPLLAESLRLRHVVDDGAVFYLNGSEVFSIGMPAARPVAYAATATRSNGVASYEPALTAAGWPIAGTNLLSAHNRLAAEVHQYAAGYSDVAFAANLGGIVSRYYPQLRWHLPSLVQEGAGTLTNQAQISLLEPLTADLLVQLASSRPLEVAVPSQVTIPAGATKVTFDLPVGDDSLYNGPRAVTLTAQPPEGLAAQAALQLWDNETNVLSVWVAASTRETNGSLPAEVRLTYPVSGNVTVALSSSDVTELTVPASVIVLDGATSAVFQATVLDDLLLDGPQTVSVAAAVPGWTGGQASVVVHDNEPVTLALQFPAFVVEGSGGLANAGKVTVGGLAVSNLVVTLASSVPADLALPTNVTILAGQSNAVFDLKVLDNLLLDGDRTVLVTATLPGFPAVTNPVALLDNDPHHIRFGVVPQIVDTNTGFGLQLTAETASGAVQTNFNLSVGLLAEGLEGLVPLEPTNSGAFYNGQKYVGFRVSAPGLAVRLKSVEYPGQSEAFNVVVPPFQSVPQKVADIVWHAPSQTLLASVPASAASYSNCLVAIDPVTGEVTNSYPIGLDPGQIEMAPGGGYLYVALSNRTILRRFDLVTRQAGLQYALGTNSMPFRFAYDFCVPPGLADSAVVETRDQDNLGNTTRAGIKRYDSGKPVSLPAFDATGAWLLESLTNGSEILLSSGLVRGNAASGSVLAISTNFLGTAAFYRDGRIYDDRANVYAAQSLGNLGFYPGVIPDLSGSPDGRYRALVDVSPSLRRVFFLGGYANYGTTFYKLVTCDRDLYQPLATFAVPGTTGGPTRLLSCGPSRLAYCTGDGQLWFVRSDGVLPTQPPADLALSLADLPATAWVGSNYTFTLSLSNSGPGLASLMRVTNTLPANVTVVQTVPSMGSVAATDSAFTWNLAALPALASARLEVTLRFNTAGWQSNTTWALGFEADPLFTNNQVRLALNVQLPPTAPGAFAVNCPAEDVIYDAGRDRLLLSVANGLADQTNGLAVFNPYTGVVESFTPLGRKPGRMVRSLDGQYLFVSLPEAAVVRQLSLPGLTLVREFGLGSEDVSGTAYPFYAGDLAAVPGSPEGLVVWRVRRAGPMAGEYGRGMVWVDAGVLRTNVTASGGNWRVEFESDAGTLFGFNNGELRRCAVDAGGVTFAETYPILYAAGDDVEYAAGRLFTSAGRVMEVQPFRVAWALAGAEGASLVEPDGVSGRVFYLVKTNASQIRAYDIGTRALLGSIAVPYLSGIPSSLVRWGANGLAFRTSANQLYVVRSALMQPAAGADVALQLTGPESPMPAGADAAFTLTITNRGPATARGVFVTNTFTPAATLGAAGSASGTIGTNAGALVWSLPQLAAGATAVLAYTISRAETGVVTVAAVTVAATLDPAPGDNTALSTLAVGVGPGVDSLALVQCPANGLVWAPALDRLLLTSASNTANWSGALLSLDPVGMAVRCERTVGCAARAITLSRDGRRLYLGVDRGIVALSVPGLAVTNHFLLDPVEPRSYATECEDLPGASNSLVVGSLGFAYNLMWLGVYDGGVRRTNFESFNTSGFSLDFGGDPGLFYYQDFAYGGFRRYTVNPGGITLLESLTSLLPTGKPIELKWADGLIYSGVGVVIDPVTRLAVRSIPGLTNVASLCYDGVSRRVYYLMPMGTNALLAAVDAVTSVPLGSRLLSGYAGSPTHLVRWGANGLAFRTTAGQVGLVRSALVADGPDADLALELSAPMPVAVVGSNFVYSVSVTNQGPHPATNVQVTLRLPGYAVATSLTASQGAVSNGLQQVVANLGSLAAGGAARVAVNLTTTQPGSVFGLASVTSSAKDPWLANNSRGLTNATVLFVGKDSVVSVSQSVADLVYNPADARLYGSGKAGAIVVINPALAQVETNWPVAGQPGRLALGEQGQTLYVALDANRQLGRVRTADGLVLTNFALGTNAAGSSLALLDMEVLRAAPDVVAVLALGGGARYLTVLDRGAPRAAPLQTVSGSYLEFGSDPARLYLSGLIPIDLATNGVSAPGGEAVFSSTSDFKFDSGVFYTDAGEQVDPVDRSSSVRFAGLGTGTLVRPEVARQRVFFLTKVGSAWQLRAYHPVTTSLVGSLAVSNVLGTPSALTRWGEDGFAFCTTSNQVFLLRSSLLASGQPADLRVSQLAAPPGPVGVGSNVTFQVQVTNAGPADALGASLQLRFPTNLSPLQVQWTQGTTNLSAGLLTCVLGTLSNGASAQVSLTLRPVSAGALVQLASVTSGAMDPDPDNNLVTTSVGVQFDLSPDAWAVVGLQTADLQYDPVSGLIYASLTNYFGPPYENGLLTINPTNGLLGQPLLAGPKATRLALAEDGSLVSVLVNNGREFRQLPLPAGAPVSRVAFSPPTESPKWSETIKAVPGQAGSVATVVQRPGILLGAPTVILYDSALARPNSVGSRAVEFYLPDRMMGYDWRIVPSQSVRLALTPTGVVAQASAGYLIDGDMAASGEFIYTSGGSVFDPRTMTKVGAFGVTGPVAPDAALDRVAFLTGSGTRQVLRVFDTHTLLELGSLSISNIAGASDRLIRCGADRFAFRTSAGQIYVLRTSLLPSGPPTDLAVRQSANPHPVLVGSNLLYTLQVTNHGPQAATNVILCDALPPSAVFVSASASSGTVSNSGGALTCRLTRLTNGGTVTVSIVVAPAQLIPLTNTASVMSSATDPLPGNNSTVLTSAVAYQAGLDSIQELKLAVRDMVYDPVQRRIYASGLGPVGGAGSSIFPLDPETGVIEPPILVGDNPGRLAVSEDGRYLHVGLNGSSAIGRVDLHTRAADLRFSIGEQVDVQDLVALPGSPAAVAVSRRALGGSPLFGGVAVYDSGVSRSNVIASHTGPNALEPGADGSVLYGFNLEDSQGGFYRMSVDAGGVSLVDMTAGLIPAFTGDILYGGGRVHTTDGLVINPETLAAVGAYANVPHASPVAVDPPLQRAFYLVPTNADWALRAYRSDTFALQGTVVVTNVSGTPDRLRRCGADRLAFLTSGGQVFLLRTSLILPRDGDQDGLPDDWELAHGLNPTNALDAALDSDCDGLSNRQEYFAGTDPMPTGTQAPLPRLSLVNGPELNTQPPKLAVFALPGYFYALQSSTNLVQWSDVTNYFGLTCATVTVDPAGSAPGRFYRVLRR